jgi:hypothetical protein
MKSNIFENYAILGPGKKNIKIPAIWVCGSTCKCNYREDAISNFIKHENIGNVLVLWKKCFKVRKCPQKQKFGILMGRIK